MFKDSKPRDDQCKTGLFKSPSKESLNKERKATTYQGFNAALPDLKFVPFKKKGFWFNLQMNFQEFFFFLNF